MKIIKYTKYILLLVIVVSFHSCLFDQNDIFEGSSAERLNASKKEAKDLLMSSPNGWIMEYFATPQSGGYTLFVKFPTDEIAIIGARNEYFTKFRTDSGTYDIKGDSGPLLSFDSYNDVLHMFANPENPDGLGLEGDYEFIVSNLTENLITLKGKKRDTHIILRRLAENEDWEAYSNKLYEMNEYLFNSKVTKLSLFIGKEFVAYDAATHVFSLLAKGDDEIVGERITVPFIITPTGIRLYEKMSDKVGDSTIEAQHFNIDMERKALVATESADVYIKGPEASSFFVDSLNWVGGNKWKMNKDNMGGRFATIYAQIVQNCKSKYKEDFDSFFFVYKPIQKSRTFSFKSGKYEGAFNFSTSIASNDKAVLKNLNIADRNGTLYLNNINGFADFLNLLDQNTYTIISDSPIRPTVLMFVSDSDKNDWFKLDLTN